MVYFLACTTMRHDGKVTIENVLELGSGGDRVFVRFGSRLQGQVCVACRCGQIVVGQTCGFLGGQSVIVDFITRSSFSNNYFISL